MVGNGLFHSAKRYNKKQRDTILWKDRFIILGNDVSCNSSVCPLSLFVAKKCLCHNKCDFDTLLAYIQAETIFVGSNKVPKTDIRLQL